MKKSLVLLVLLFSTTVLWAYDYVFETYHLDLQVSPSNVYTIQEDIQADFYVPKHGIYREIPVRFGKKRVELTDLQSSEPIIQDSVSSDYITFRLGSADRTVTGKKDYSLSYSYDIGDDGYDDYDELYFNVLGPGWQSPIKSFSYTIRFPKPIDPSMIWVTGGSYGTTTQRGTYTLSSDRKTLSGEAFNLNPGEALTVRVQMEQGYFTGMTVHRDYTLPLSLLVLFAGLAVCIYATLLFRKYGKEDLFVPVVRFEPPEGFSPLEVGYIADGVVDNKDLTSLFFYWADQGCLTIEEEGKKEITFTKLQPPATDKRHERQLFDAFFACGDGTTVTLKQLETEKFSEAMQRAKSSVHAYFKGDRKLKDGTAEKKRVVIFLLMALLIVFSALSSTISYLAEGTAILLALGFFCALVSGLVSYRLTSTWELRGAFSKTIKIISFALFCLLAYVFAFIIEAFIIENEMGYSFWMALVVVFIPLYLSFLGVVTAKRSPYASKMLEQTIGYRDFIKRVEVDKLKMMIDDDPQIFYHVLGYAIVLGLEDTWAKKFSSLTFDPPTWYYGQRSLHNALFYSALSHRLHSNVMEHTLYAQAKGGSSGGVHSSFGSGGFSGGGFGGGGGGAW